MDALLVGFVSAGCTVVVMLYWLLLVRPDTLLSLLGDEDAWLDPSEPTPASLHALRGVAGTTVLLFGFLTGLTVAFLAATP